MVAELKRDRAPDSVEMQAIKYAAMVSRFTEDTLVEQHARFLSRDVNVVAEDAARQRLIERAGDLDPELLRRPRIVLVAGEFPPVLTATVVWLNEMGLDVTLQRVQAYRVPGDQIVVLVSQVFPVLDVEEFTVSPVRQRLQEAEDRRRTVKEQSTVVRLVAAGSIPDGTSVFLRPTTDVSREVRDMVQEWVDQDPRRGRARWYNDRRRPLEWEYDQGRYRPTAIVRRILAEAAGLQRAPRGPAWWVLEDGRNLPTVAGVPNRGRFDWTELHEVLAAVPAGRWTTYGDLADLVNTAARPLGQHIQTCPSCPNAQRVLSADGTPRPGFVWADPAETRSQQEALEAEGVPFPDGAADPGLRHAWPRSSSTNDQEGSMAETADLGRLEPLQGRDDVGFGERLVQQVTQPATDPFADRVGRSGTVGALDVDPNDPTIHRLFPAYLSNPLKIE